MSRLLCKFVPAVIMALLLAACGSAGGTRTVASAATVLPPPDTTTAAGVYEGASEYRVGPQDLLEISVFGIDELDSTTRVNSNGQISLPLIGVIMAGGRTVPELEQNIAAKLAQGYVQNPQVSVFVKEYTSQRITMEGEVKNPGIYPLTGKTTLIQAIATASGLTEFADLQGIVLFRQVNGQRKAAAFDIAAIRKGEAPDPRVYGDDVIVVERSGSKSALREFLRTLPALGFFMAL